MIVGVGIDVVDIARGLRPWMCLCYGNGLYDEAAAKVFGAVGCPPIKTEEQKAAWHRYVATAVARAVYRALTDKRPRTRYFVGFDAHVVNALRRVLTDPMFDRLIRATRR